MADVISRRSIVYDLTFNTTQAKKGATDIGGAMKSAEQQIDKATQSVDEFSAKTLSSVARLRQMKNELNNFKGTEAQFQKLSIEAAKLQDQINKTNQRIRTLASSTRNIQALTSAFQGITGVFVAAQGAQALFGKESENVTKALVKLQGAMALLQGVEAAVATVREQSVAKTVIMNQVTKVYTFVTNGATAATRLFRTALIATGVGAAIVALTTVIAYWQDIAEWIGIAEKNTKEAEKAQEEFAARVKKSADDINDQVKAQILLNQVSSGGTDEAKRRVAAMEAEGAAEEDLFIARQEVRHRELDDLKQFQKTAVTTREEGLELIRSIANKEAEIENARTEFMRKEAEKQEAIRRKLITGENIKFEPTELEKLRKEIAQAFGIDEDSAKDLGERFGEAFKKALKEELADDLQPVTTLVDVDALEKEMQDAAEREKTRQELVRDSVIASAEQTLQALMQLSSDGSKAQLALAGVAIFANQAQAIAAAIAAAAEAAKNTGGLSLPVLIPSFIGIALSTFAQVNSLMAQAKAAQSNVEAFAEGEVDIHRPGEKAGKDSIPAVIMPGETVTATDKTKRYKPFLEAIHEGSLEDLIRVNYVEPALALKALDNAANDSKQTDYSDKFYRQYLATGEGNINGKRMVYLLAQIRKDLKTNKPRYH